MRGLLVLMVATFVILRAEDAKSCDIPLQPTRTSFVATVRIGLSAPLRFLVDTGASLTVVDRSVAERVGLSATGTLEAIATGGAMRVSTAVAEEFSAGIVKVRDLAVLITSLPTFASHGRVHGILGMNFLKGRSFVLSRRQGCLDLDVTPIAGDRLEAQEVVGRIAIEAHEMNFVIDSGASFVVLLSERARQLASRGGDATITTAAGQESAQTGTIPTLSIGKRKRHDVHAVLGRSTGNALEDGLLPVTFFQSLYVDASRTFVVVN
jgi:clan AA aspartic protease (TIGR02281 family)